MHYYEFGPYRYQDRINIWKTQTFSSFCSVKNFYGHGKRGFLSEDNRYGHR